MKPDRITLGKLYTKESLSVREIAGLLGLHYSTVHYHLKRFHIERRKADKRSKLRNYSRATILQGIKDKGLRGYARELRIHENTLRNYRALLLRKK